MTTIVILALFLMAASATPIQNTPNIADNPSPNDTGLPHDILSPQPPTEDTDQHHQNNSNEPPPDVARDEPHLNDALQPSDEDDTNNNETGAATPSVELPTSGEDNTTHNSVDAHSPSVSPVSTISTEATWIENSEPTSITNEPVPNESTPHEPITTPADGDHFDCHPKNISTHVYHLCLFTCNGDEAVALDRGEPCILNYTGNPDEENNSTEPNENKRGVCVGGQCVPRTDVTGTHSQSSPAVTTPTTGVPSTSTQSAETTPQTTTPKTSDTSESNIPEGPGPEPYIGAREFFQGPPGTPTNDTPVAMP